MYNSKRKRRFRNEYKAPILPVDDDEGKTESSIITCGKKTPVKCVENNRSEFEVPISIVDISNLITVDSDDDIQVIGSKDITPVEFLDSSHSYFRITNSDTSTEYFSHYISDDSECELEVLKGSNSGFEKQSNSIESSFNCCSLSETKEKNADEEVKMISVATKKCFVRCEKLDLSKLNFTDSTYASVSIKPLKISDPCILDENADSSNASLHALKSGCVRHEKEDSDYQVLNEDQHLLPLKEEDMNLLCSDLYQNSGSHSNIKSGNLNDELSKSALLAVIKDQDALCCNTSIHSQNESNSKLGKHESDIPYEKGFIATSPSLNVRKLSYFEGQDAPEVFVIQNSYESDNLKTISDLFKSTGDKKVASTAVPVSEKINKCSANCFSNFESQGNKFPMPSGTSFPEEQKHMPFLKSEDSGGNFISEQLHIAEASFLSVSQEIDTKVPVSKCVTSEVGSSYSENTVSFPAVDMEKQKGKHPVFANNVQNVDLYESSVKSDSTSFSKLSASDDEIFKCFSSMSTIENGSKFSYESDSVRSEHVLEAKVNLEGKDEKLLVKNILTNVTLEPASSSVVKKDTHPGRSMKVCGMNSATSMIKKFEGNKLQQNLSLNDGKTCINEYRNNVSINDVNSVSSISTVESVCDMNTASSVVERLEDNIFQEIFDTHVHSMTHKGNSDFSINSNKDLCNECTADALAERSEFKIRTQEKTEMSTYSSNKKDYRDSSMNSMNDVFSTSSSSVLVEESGGNYVDQKKSDTHSQSSNEFMAANLHESKSITQISSEKSLGNEEHVTAKHKEKMDTPACDHQKIQSANLLVNSAPIKHSDCNGNMQQNEDVLIPIIKNCANKKPLSLNEISLSSDNSNSDINNSTLIVDDTASISHSSEFSQKIESSETKMNVNIAVTNERDLLSVANKESNVHTSELLQTTSEPNESSLTSTNVSMEKAILNSRSTLDSSQMALDNMKDDTGCNLKKTLKLKLGKLISEKNIGSDKKSYNKKYVQNSNRSQNESREGGTHSVSDNSRTEKLVLSIYKTKKGKRGRRSKSFYSSTVVHGAPKNMANEVTKFHCTDKLKENVLLEFENKSERSNSLIMHSWDGSVLEPSTNLKDNISNENLSPAENIGSVSPSFDLPANKPKIKAAGSVMNSFENGAAANITSKKRKRTRSYLSTNRKKSRARKSSTQSSCVALSMEVPMVDSQICETPVRKSNLRKPNRENIAPLKCVETPVKSPLVTSQAPVTLSKTANFRRNCKEVTKPFKFVETPVKSPLVISQAPVTLSKTANFRRNCKEITKPFKFGWMREVVHRSTSSPNNKTRLDIYYFTPEGTKLRSMPEVGSYLTKHPTCDLQLSNFTFAKERIYRYPFEKERAAKGKTQSSPVSSTLCSFNDVTPQKKEIEPLLSPNSRSTKKNCHDHDSTNKATCERRKIEPLLLTSFVSPKDNYPEQTLPNDVTPRKRKTEPLVTSNSRSAKKNCCKQSSQNEATPQRKRIRTLLVPNSCSLEKNSHEICDSKITILDLQNRNMEQSQTKVTEVVCPPAAETSKSTFQYNKSMPENSLSLETKRPEENPIRRKHIPRNLLPIFHDRKLSPENNPLPALPIRINQKKMHKFNSPLKLVLPVKIGNAVNYIKRTEPGGVVHDKTKKVGFASTAQEKPKKDIPSHVKKKTDPDSFDTGINKPCSKFCLNGKGEDPTLQCVQCLCLFHPRCVSFSQNIENFKCKLCSVNVYANFEASKETCQQNINSKSQSEGKVMDYCKPVFKDIPEAVFVPEIVMEKKSASQDEPKFFPETPKEANISIDRLLQSSYPSPLKKVSFSDSVAGLSITNKPSRVLKVENNVKRMNAAPEPVTSCGVQTHPLPCSRPPLNMPPLAPKFDFGPSKVLLCFPISHPLNSSVIMSPSGSVTCSSTTSANISYSSTTSTSMNSTATTCANVTSSGVTSAFTNRSCVPPYPFQSYSISVPSTSVGNVRQNIPPTYVTVQNQLPYPPPPPLRRLCPPHVPLTVTTSAANNRKSIAPSNKNNSWHSAFPQLSNDCSHYHHLSHLLKNNSELLAPKIRNVLQISNEQCGKQATNADYHISKLENSCITMGYVSVSKSKSKNWASRIDTSKHIEKVESFAPKPNLSLDGTKKNFPCKFVTTTKCDSGEISVVHENTKMSLDCPSSNSSKLSPKHKNYAENVTCSFKSGDKNKMMRPTALNQLMWCYESLNLVFKMLSVNDLLRVQKVCHSWKYLASQSFLWKNVSFRGITVINWKRCFATLQKFGTTALDLRGLCHQSKPDYTWEKFASAFKHSKNIKKVTFGQISPSSLYLVTASLRHLKELECFCLTDLNIEPKMWNFICSFDFGSMQGLEELESLKIRSAGGLNDLYNGLSSVFTLKNLQHLSITSLKQKQDWTLHLLGNLPNLVTLELGDCIDWIYEDYKALSTLHRLQGLRLENGGDASGAGLIEAVTGMNSLQELRLINFKIPKQLGMTLRRKHSLRCLSLWPDISIEAAQMNYNTLEAVSKLKKLKYFSWGILLSGRSKKPADGYTPLVPILKHSSETDDHRCSPTELLCTFELLQRLLFLLPDVEIQVECINKSQFNKYWTAHR